MTISSQSHSQRKHSQPSLREKDFIPLLLVKYWSLVSCICCPKIYPNFYLGYHSFSSKFHSHSNYKQTNKSSPPLLTYTFSHPALGRHTPNLWHLILCSHSSGFSLWKASCEVSFGSLFKWESLDWREKKRIVQKLTWK